MKPLLTTVLAATVVLLAFIKQQINSDGKSTPRFDSQRKLVAISCSPDWKAYPISKEAIQQMPALPGTGNHKWKISTANDSAQFYFNQGINLYYGFHIIEALPSFKKAQTFDPECAMLYWAEALAYGPNINDIGYSATPETIVASRKASELSDKCSEKEKALISTMLVRYSPDSTQKREKLNKDYAEAMKTTYARFTNDPEISTLYADALMLLHPWDLWQHNGTPKPWTNEIISVLEKVLKIAPDHPGANHYYIHAVEASPFPFKANASAEKLGKLTPGLSHMVHMPSHIFIRTGQYEKGIKVNETAVRQYQHYLNLYPDVVNNAPLYDFHNRHMQAACSNSGKDYNKAIRDALECRNSLDTAMLSLPMPLGGYIQFVYMMPEFTMVTFEKWNEILEQPLENKHTYAFLLQQFARGLAYSNTKELKKAETALKNIDSLMREEGMEIPFGPFNAPKDAATVAREILKGSIAERQGLLNESLRHYNNAVQKEDALIYNEPRDWLLTARHFLGNALLRMKNYPAAEKVFREELKMNPNNYISTKGLQASLQKRGK